MTNRSARRAAADRNHRMMSVSLSRFVSVRPLRPISSRSCAQSLETIDDSVVRRIRVIRPCDYLIVEFRRRLQAVQLKQQLYFVLPEVSPRVEDYLAAVSAYVNVSLIVLQQTV